MVFLCVMAEGSSQAPIPCTHLCSDTEKDSCPIVSETTHVNFAEDRPSSGTSSTFCSIFHIGFQHSISSFPKAIWGTQS